MSILFPAIIGSSKRRSVSYAWDFTTSSLPSGWTFDGVGTCAGNQGGNQSLYVASNTNSSSGGAVYSFPANTFTNTYDMFFRYMVPNGGSGKNRPVYINNAFSFTYTSGIPSSASINSIAGSGFTTASFTYYYIWVEARPQSIKVFTSSNTTKPGSHAAQITTGGSYAALTRLNLSNSHSSGTYFGRLRVSSSSIGSNPA